MYDCFIIIKISLIVCFVLESIYLFLLLFAYYVFFYIGCWRLKLKSRKRKSSVGLPSCMLGHVLRPRATHFRPSCRWYDEWSGFDMKGIKIWNPTLSSPHLTHFHRLTISHLAALLSFPQPASSMVCFHRHPSQAYYGSTAHGALAQWLRLHSSPPRVVLWGSRPPCHCCSSSFFMLS
jgi:hypothetical protein